MILQIDPRLKSDPAWAENGCALMSCFFFVNKFTNYPFDPKAILTLGQFFRENHLVEKDLRILDWERIFNFFPSMYVHYTDRHEPPSRMCHDKEFEILQWYNPRTGLKHFTAGNGYGYETYDPLGTSVTVKEGFLQTKRIFRNR